MQAKCVVCRGSGMEDQVDPTIPPPPCRVCRPVEAARHQMLARATLRIDTAHRFDAFLALRDARRTPYRTVLRGPIEPVSAAHRSPFRPR